MESFSKTSNGVLFTRDRIHSSGVPDTFLQYSENFTIPEGEVKREKVLGQGKFGVVFKGRYRGVSVAVKEIQAGRSKSRGSSSMIENENEGNSSDSSSSGFDVDNSNGTAESGLSLEEMRRYVEREVTVLKNLTHPNVVSCFGMVILDSDEKAPRWHVVLEYLGGSDLRDIWKSRQEKNLPRLSWAAVARLLQGAASGLRHLHAMEVLHRDIKTENIMTTHPNPESPLCRAKLVDLGFARNDVNKNKPTASSMPGGKTFQRRMTVCGTDAFMAPELYLQESEYTSAVDIFSFGITIAEVVSCKIPGDNGFLERRVQSFFELDADEIRLELISDCPDSLVELTVACCASEPEDRPEASQLDNWLSELSVDLRSSGEIIDTTTHQTLDEDERLESSPDENENEIKPKSQAKQKFVIAALAVVFSNVHKAENAITSVSAMYADRVLLAVRVDTKVLCRAIAERGGSTLTIGYKGKARAAELQQRLRKFLLVEAATHARKAEASTDSFINSLDCTKSKDLRNAISDRGGATRTPGFKGMARIMELKQRLRILLMSEFMLQAITETVRTINDVGEEEEDENETEEEKIENELNETNSNSEILDIERNETNGNESDEEEVRDMPEIPVDLSRSRTSTSEVAMVHSPSRKFTVPDFEIPPRSRTTTTGSFVLPPETPIASRVRLPSSQRQATLDIASAREDIILKGALEKKDVLGTWTCRDIELTKTQLRFKTSTARRSSTCSGSGKWRSIELTDVCYVVERAVGNADTSESFRFFEILTNGSEVLRFRAVLENDKEVSLDSIHEKWRDALRNAMSSAVAQPVYSGWLWKKSRSRLWSTGSKWKKRFFVLTPSRLVYYYSDEDTQKEAKAKNSLDLHSYSVVSMLDAMEVNQGKKSEDDKGKHFFKVETAVKDVEQRESIPGVQFYDEDNVISKGKGNEKESKPGTRLLYTESALDRLTWVGKIRKVIDNRVRARAWFGVTKRLSVLSIEK
eukprot:g3356.t1